MVRFPGKTEPVSQQRNQERDDRGIAEVIGHEDEQVGPLGARLSIDGARSATYSLVGPPSLRRDLIDNARASPACRITQRCQKLSRSNLRFRCSTHFCPPTPSCARTLDYSKVAA
jgi:hypothetical protein